MVLIVIYPKVLVGGRPVDAVFKCGLWELQSPPCWDHLGQTMEVEHDFEVYLCNFMNDTFTFYVMSGRAVVKKEQTI